MLQPNHRLQPTPRAIASLRRSGNGLISRIFAHKAVSENFARLLEATARRFPDRTALVWDGGALTYAELDQQAAGFAYTLAEQGLRSG
ncbi:MAG: AMP-binding protein, partial [Candidatus Binatia bacterium]